MQWLRIRLPMQGTRVRALVWEDPTCRGATKLVCHNYWARVPQLLKPACLEPVLCNKRSHHNKKPRTATKSSPRSPQLEKVRAQQRRPNTAKKRKKKRRLQQYSRWELWQPALSHQLKELYKWSDLDMFWRQNLQSILTNWMWDERETGIK